VTEPVAAGEEGEEERREAAEALHALGTEEALRRLDQRPGHASARALLRDARWDVPGAGPVPLLGAPAGLTAARILVHLRLRRALRLAGRRWTGASAGGATAGVVGGTLGGIALVLAPGSAAHASVVVPLALVGAAVGGLGAAGVGAGLAMAESLARSWRGLALVSLGALGGAVVGFAAHVIGRWTLAALFGQDLWMVGGGLEGLGLGAAAGLGYALATPRPEGGMAAPRGSERIRAALVAGLCCALAGIALTWVGRSLAGASLNAMARAFQGSQVGLSPVARLVGEREMGPVTRTVMAGLRGPALRRGPDPRPDPPPAASAKPHVERGGAAQRRRLARGVSGGVANTQLTMCECPPDLASLRLRRAARRRARGVSGGARERPTR
jgi:hypothetical protein